MAESNEAKVGQIRLSVGVALCPFGQRSEMIGNHKSRRYQAVSDHRENKSGVFQVKSCFGQHGITGQQGAVNSGRNLQRPSMMPIIPIGKSYQKAGVGNSSRLLANALRADKSRGTSTDSARWRNGCSALRRASSSCSRMIRRRGTPAFREADSSYAAKSSGRRTVIVLLICPECKTACSPLPSAYLSLAAGSLLCSRWPLDFTAAAMKA